MYVNVTVLGRIGGDPDMRYTPEGTAIVSFSVAVNRKNKSGEEATDWYRVYVFGKFAESISEYIRKGDLILVSGELTPRLYNDRYGDARLSLEITTRELRLIGRTTKTGSMDRQIEQELNDADLSI